MRRQWLFIISLLFALSFIPLSIKSSQSQVGIINGTVKDPNGAVVAGAQITVRNETTGETRNATADGQGRFKIEGLAPGRYTLSIARNGFKTAERGVAIESGRTETVEIKLEVAETRAEVTVGAKGAITPNSDPNYRGLRDAKPAETYTVSNLTLKRDAATINLISGRVSFLPPALGRVVIGVFVGEGEFTLEPYLFIERNHLKLRTEKETVNEPFSRLALAFTDNTWQEIKSQSQPAGAEADSQAQDTLRDLQNRLRDRLRGGGENLEAELLADLYNPKLAGAFNAFIFGKRWNDLRFHVRPRGALDCEEVVLLNADRNSDQAGVWYSGHLESEYKNNTASSEEDKRVIDVEHYKIENAIRGEKLTATAEMTFTALVDGERVLSLGLLDELRVSRALFGDKETNFIQEDKRKDGSFYVIFPESLVKGRKYKLTMDYQGEKVLTDAGGGNFAVGFRTSWYPSVNAFNDRSTFDLTFKVPKQYTLISVGKLVKEWQEGDYAASQWISDVPLAVAGFNYGRFKKKEVTDADTKYQIEGYAVTEMPDGLRNTGIGGMAPSRLIDNSLAEATNSMRVFTHYFGPLPYGRIAITQQPQANFGQAWPTLVFLPLVSYLDSTQRWMLLGNNRGLTEFVDEVNAHEVSHQWWGHIVGWASYHDQWLSEGAAFFSAGLYLKATEQKPDKYLNYWKHAQEALFEKNNFGLRPNDAAPVWMGWRSRYHKVPNAPQALIYRKGGYVMHMLHQMMYDRQNGDKAFIAMMQDFVKTHYNRNASTESFRQIVEKHMLPKMDLAGDKRMDWFFFQWVYGTEIPRYRLDYTLTPQEDGKCLLTGTVTQSDVSPGFRMLVPVYLDFDGKLMRLGEVGVMGSSTSQEFKVMLPKKPRRVLINANYDVLATESVSAGK
jgi:hypothetical protein